VAWGDVKKKRGGSSDEPLAILTLSNVNASCPFVACNLNPERFGDERKLLGDNDLGSTRTVGTSGGWPPGHVVGVGRPGMPRSGRGDMPALAWSVWPAW
jgi:hypothetical protein